MTIQEARKLKWGTSMRPSAEGRRALKEFRHGIFLGLNRDKTLIVVLPMGIRTPSTYAPKFWMPERKLVA